jgi:hypothetical protein
MFNPLASGGGMGGEGDESNSQGVVLSQILDVMRILKLSPEILSKSELHSLFV